VTNGPIDLDGRRTPQGKIEIALRRNAANSRKRIETRGGESDAALDAAMLVEPARSWIAAMDKVRFLLERYSASPEARDARVQKLIGRAMSDLARLKKREEGGS
jgi:hypothetical protein